MEIAKHLSKISWSVADKMTFVLYGIANILMLKITNSFELGIFTLFNNLHNFIITFSAYFSLQALLHFSADDNQKPLINTYSMFNFVIITGFLTFLVVFFKDSISIILNEPHFVDIAQALPILTLLSIIRYFNIFVICREMKLSYLFIVNLVYFGTMSIMIFIAILHNYFLDYNTIIYINYIGCGLSALVSIFLIHKYWRFSLKGTIKYKDVVSFSAKYTASSISLSVPRLLDVFAIQYFFGTNVVGLYAPAKTIFRFVEDGVVTINTILYTPMIKYFTNNNINDLKQLLSKAISLLFVVFLISTFISFIFAEPVFSLFLPDKFINSVSFFNMLMLVSIVLPFNLFSNIISASGKPELNTKYGIIACLVWLIAFYIVGKYFSAYPTSVAIPYFAFYIAISIPLYIYINKHLGYSLAQLFRIIPDGYYFIKKKINYFNS